MALLMHVVWSASALIFRHLHPAGPALKRPHGAQDHGVAYAHGDLMVEDLERHSHLAATQGLPTSWGADGAAERGDPAAGRGTGWFAAPSSRMGTPAGACVRACAPPFKAKPALPTCATPGRPLSVYVVVMSKIALLWLRLSLLGAL
eukprot:1158528-Pelagomonas_calceolata.AAC.7